jgi:hypothetical protein
VTSVIARSKKRLLLRIVRHSRMIAAVKLLRSLERKGVSYVSRQVTPVRPVGVSQNRCGEQQQLASVGHPQSPGRSSSVGDIRKLIDLPPNVYRTAEWSSQVARRIHTPKVAGSNPASAICRHQASVRNSKLSKVEDCGLVPALSKVVGLGEYREARTTPNGWVTSPSTLFPNVGYPA